MIHFFGLLGGGGDGLGRLIVRRGFSGKDFPYLGLCHYGIFQSTFFRGAQRAIVAARLANLGEGRPKTTQICAVSQDQAASMLNVGKRSVQLAKEVMRKAPEKIKDIEGGDPTGPGGHQVRAPLQDRRGPGATGEAQGGAGRRTLAGGGDTRGCYSKTI